MSYAPAPFNPYASPGAPGLFPPPGPLPPPPGTPRAPRGTALTWLCGAAVPCCAVLLGAWRLGEHLAWPKVITGLAALGYVAAVLTTLVLSMAWLALAWGDVPPQLRQGLSPLSAVGRNFIPLYGFVWIFRMVDRLCSTLDAQLAWAGVLQRAPRHLGHLAAACTVAGPFLVRPIPALDWLPSLVAHGLWFAYMLRCDAARQAIANAQLRAVVELR